LVKPLLRYGNFFIFQDGSRRRLGFLNFRFLTLRRVRRIELRYHAKFHCNLSNRYRDTAIFQFFQDGGRAPSWICVAHVWTTHEEYLVVFIAAQNLVGIGIVVLKICEFQYYGSSLA